MEDRPDRRRVLKCNQSPRLGPGALRVGPGWTELGGPAPGIETGIWVHVSPV